MAAGVIYNDSCRALLPTFRIVRAYHSKARDAFGYIGVSDAERLVVAAFKGSNETEDFITDAEGPFRYRFSCAPDDGGDVSLGKTHHGFCACVGLGVCCLCVLLVLDGWGGDMISSSCVPYAH